MISVIIWSLICLFYCVKILLLIYANLINKLSNDNNKIKNYLAFTSRIINYGGYIAFLIGFIYDIWLLILNKDTGRMLYLYIYCLSGYGFYFTSNLDFKNLDNFIKLICRQNFKNELKEDILKKKEIVGDNLNKKKIE